MNRDITNQKIILEGYNYRETKPFFTVLVFDYIRHEYTPEAIRSVLNQSISNGLVELLILTDDIDGDFSYIPKTFPFVVCYTGLIIFGESMALGLQISRGEVVCLLDNDDKWLADKLHDLYFYFTHFPEIGFIKDEIIPMVNGEDKRLNLRFRLRMNIHRNSTDSFFILEKNPPNEILGRALTHNNSSMSIRKNSLNIDFKLFSEISYFQDVTIFFTMALKCKYTSFLDKRLTYYRVAQDKIGQNRSNSQKLFRKEIFQNNLELFQSNFYDKITWSSKQYLKDLYTDLILTSKMYFNARYKKYYHIRNKDVFAMLIRAIRTKSINKILVFFLYIGSKIFGLRVAKIVWGG